jgi:hypothetical protein
MEGIDGKAEVLKAVEEYRKAIKELGSFIPSYLTTQAQALKTVAQNDSLSNDSKRKAVMSSLMLEADIKKEGLELAVKQASATLEGWKAVSLIGKGGL